MHKLSITKSIIINTIIGCFQFCTSLKSITIPNSVTSIDQNAFVGCTGLTSITIPNSVTSIGQSAFWNCTGLTSITLSNNLTNIDYWAFQNCESLTAIKIPKTLTILASEAFRNCTGLTDVTCKAKKLTTEWGGESLYALENVFRDSNIEKASLHVPAQSLDSYKATKPWSAFSNIEALPAPTAGDANWDDTVNEEDVEEVSKSIMGNPTTAFEKDAADVNKDGQVDIVDIVDILTIVNK